MMPGVARRKIGLALADGLHDGGRRSLSLTLSSTSGIYLITTTNSGNLLQ